MSFDDRPNILLLMCDQLSARVMRLYGGPVPMPQVERLAADGKVFRRAYASSMACSPSRACLFTGTYPHTHGVAHNVDRRDYAGSPWIDRVPPREEGIRATDTTLGSCLHAAGYDTRYYGKWHLLGDDLPYWPDLYTEKDYLAEMAATFDRYRREAETVMDWNGWMLPVQQTPAFRRAVADLGDRWRERLFQEFATKIGRLTMPVDETFDARVTQRAVAYLENTAETPFALVCSWLYPHDPYVIPSPYYEMFDPAALELPENFHQREARFENDWTREFVRGLGETGLREWLRIYYGAMRFVDDQVGRVLAALEGSGRAGNTIVVFTSDHGDLAGAHGMAWKNTSALYEDLVRVPLVCRVPGRRSPGVADVLTANVDLMPTLLSLAGVEVPAACAGRDLSAWLAGDSAPATAPRHVVTEVLASHPERRRVVECGRAASYMIRDDRWKYVRYQDGGEFLYDLEHDPFETRNRRDDPASEPALAVLRSALAQWQQETA